MCVPQSERAYEADGGEWGVAWGDVRAAVGAGPPLCVGNERPEDLPVPEGSFKVYFLRAPRKRSGLRCLAAPRTPTDAHVVPPQVALVPLYAPPAPDISWDCDRYDVPKRNCKLPSSPRRVSAPHSSADTPRSPPKRYLLLPPRLWCVLIIRIMIRSASEQALLSARPPLSRLFQSELHASFPSASHPPTGQGLEVASRLYSRLAAPSCPVPNDMLVTSKCT